MTSYWEDDWNFGAEEDPAYRAKVLRTKLFDPLGITLSGPEIIGGKHTDSPEVAERKRREAAERLERHDLLFHVTPSCTIGDEYKITRPRATAGDPDAGDE